MNLRLREIASIAGAEALVRFDEPMSRHTTLRVGGPADCYIEPASEESLARIVRFCHDTRTPMFFVGRGSNLLVRDGGIRGVVVCLAQPAFAGIVVSGSELHCGAGAKLKQVSVQAKRHGLSGLEFLEGIPGSVGGALRMNAGAMKREMFDVTVRVRYMDPYGGIREVSREDLHVEYRKCDFLQTRFAIGAVVSGVPAEPQAIEALMNECNRKRWDSQPAAPSAGCIFKNSPTVPSGRLVQELGLKGLRVGGAMVSDVHGNFIVNDGGATADDVLQLINIIRERAWRERSIALETEVQIVGEPLASAQARASGPELVHT